MFGPAKRKRCPLSMRLPVVGSRVTNPVGAGGGAVRGGVRSARAAGGWAAPASTATAHVDIIERRFILGTSKC